jgi:uncharacterized protein YgbK (DUF1537 family)
MHEADLRRHLRAQGVEDVGLMDWRKLGSAATSELDAMIDAAPSGTVLFDALDESHLARIGELVWPRAIKEPLLAVGASSVAQAVIAHWRRIGIAPERGAESGIKPAEGPVFVLAGSQSLVTVQQTAFALCDASLYQAVCLDPSQANGDALDFVEEADVCARLLGEGRSVLAYLGAVTEGGPSRLTVAQASARLLKRVLQRVPAVRRVGIAGGDTSSLSVEALSLWALGFAGTLAPGVSLTRVHSDDRRLDGLELMLKGGQMGPQDIFERLLRGT